MANLAQRIAALVLLGTPLFSGCERKEEGLVGLISRGRGSPPRIIEFGGLYENVGRIADLSYSVEDDNLTRITIYQNGSSVVDVRDLGEEAIAVNGIYPLPTGRPGRHRFQLEASDSTGNVVRSNSVYVTASGNILDRPPRSVIIESEQGPVVNESTGISVRIEDFGDNAGVMKLIGYEDNGPITENYVFQATNIFTTGLTATPQESGTYTFKVRAIDFGGNIKDSNTIRIQFDVDNST